MTKLYGAVVTGCSGSETFYCTSRSLADKIRVVTRKYSHAGHFTGARTMTQLVQLILEQRKWPAGAIIEIFISRGLIASLREQLAELTSE